jgi:hypothetical protein
MKSNRRDFLKKASIAGAGTVAGSMLTGFKSDKETKSNLQAILKSARQYHSQRFNMSGYAAPSIPLVRIGIIGLGDRGSDAVQRSLIY